MLFVSPTHLLQQKIVGFFCLLCEVCWTFWGLPHALKCWWDGERGSGSCLKGIASISIFLCDASLPTQGLLASTQYSSVQRLTSCIQQNVTHLVENNVSILVGALTNCTNHCFRARKRLRVEWNHCEINISWHHPRVSYVSFQLY